MPTGAGLSSSAALVCSSAIAVMSSMGESFAKARRDGLSRLSSHPCVQSRSSLTRK